MIRAVKTLWILLIVFSTALLAGCSYRAQFILVNESGKPINVTYQLQNTNNLIVFPMLGISTVKQFQKHNNYDPLPQDRITIDTTNLIYRVELKDQEILFLTMVDIRDINDEPVFKAGLSEISIKGENGSANYSGDQIFSQFVPSWRGIFPSAPMLYTITYK